MNRYFLNGILQNALVCIVFSVSISFTALAQKSTASGSILAQENLVAWCIVPFDNQNRTPKERIDMLKALNFSKYAYDWRSKHLDSLPEEIKLAKENKIQIVAVWMWMDKNNDAVGKLSPDNERLLKMLKESGLKTQLWLGFNSNCFDYDDEGMKVSKGVEMIKFLRQHTVQSVTGIGLYNHGDWFGDPKNQIKIIKALNDPDVGLIYNFHHAHEQIEAFPELVKEMSPWLWTVNLNGMKKDGPKILTIGSGEKESEMIKTLMKGGFRGTVGILGHIEDEDVRQVLQRNLEGLRLLEKKL